MEMVVEQLLEGTISRTRGTKSVQIRHFEQGEVGFVSCLTYWKGG